VLELRAREDDPWVALHHSLLPKALRGEVSAKAPLSGKKCIKIEKKYG
jgi:hypothetical protein